MLICFCQLKSVISKGEGFFTFTCRYFRKFFFVVAYCLLIIFQEIIMKTNTKVLLKRKRHFINEPKEIHFLGKWRCHNTKLIHQKTLLQSLLNNYYH